MKALKIIGIVLAVILGIFLLVPAFLSSSYAVERSITINAPAEKVFASIIDLKAWEKWNYWSLQDPKMKRTYSENTKGLGSSYSWESKDFGKGTMTIKGVEPNKTIDTELDFGEQGKGKGKWIFEEKDNKTKLIWRFYGEQDGYISRYFAAMMDSFMDEPMRESLNKIKSESEKVVNTN